MHTDLPAVRPDVAIPAEGRCLFYGDTSQHIGWNNIISIVSTLSLEELPRRHTHHACLDPLSFELLVGIYT